MTQHSHPAPDQQRVSHEPPSGQIEPERLRADLARLWDRFCTADGRTMPSLSADEQVMVVLSRPERVTGPDREQLARMMANRYAAGATLPELAGVIRRSKEYVRKLILEAGGTIRTPNPGAGAEPETTEPEAWAGPPEPMSRVQPETLDWSWTDHIVYTAELVLELYVQGRSYDEVAAVTGYPADDIRAMALAAGVARPHRVEHAIAAWRTASRARLRNVHRMTLLIAWIDGAEVDDLAAAHRVPADMLWDLIDAECARTDRRHLTNQPLGTRGPGYPPPHCAGIACLFGCSHVCAATLHTDPGEGRGGGSHWPGGARTARRWLAASRGPRRPDQHQRRRNRHLEIVRQHASRLNKPAYHPAMAALCSAPVKAGTGAVSWSPVHTLAGKHSRPPTRTNPPGPDTNR